MDNSVADITSGLDELARLGADLARAASAAAAAVDRVTRLSDQSREYATARFELMRKECADIGDMVEQLRTYQHKLSAMTGFDSGMN